MFKGTIVIVRAKENKRERNIKQMINQDTSKAAVFPTVALLASEDCLMGDEYSTIEAVGVRK